MTALITQYDAYTPAAPYLGGAQATSPSHPTDPVVVQLSTGPVTVFASVQAALQCLEYMRQAKQWLLWPADNVYVVAVDWTKLLVLERTTALDTLLRGYIPIYAGGVTKFVQRGASTVAELATALSASGLVVTTLLPDNAALVAAGLAVQVVDWNYQAAAAPGAGSQLRDNVVLEYR